MKNKISLALLKKTIPVALSLFHSFGLAAEISGEISTSGDPATRQTFVNPTDSASPIQICPKGRQFELTQLAGTIATIDGEFSKIKNSKQECFFAEDYKINEIAKGRPAIIGQLKKIEKNKYAVVNENGKIWNLSQLPRGLKDLLNKTIICDLVANDASSGETTWLIARAFQMPTP